MREFHRITLAAHMHIKDRWRGAQQMIVNGVISTPSSISRFMTGSISLFRQD